MLYFNSIKVRLERDKSLSGNYLAPKFQFHKGAIRTTANSISTVALIFQFHKGAIRTFDNGILVSGLQISIP